MVTPDLVAKPARLWPAVLVTFLTGMGFASLKFVLITEIALTYDPATHTPLPFEYLEKVLQACNDKGNLSEAVGQGMATMLTFGVLVGYAVNSPLAGAWRVAPLFALSCALVSVGMLASLVFNPWPIAFVIGLAYGTACAARGKVIPLLAAATGRHNTQVSGYINAALVVGLLAGTIFGNILGDLFVRDKFDTQVLKAWMSHVLLAAFMGVATWASFLVRVEDPHPTPFRTGLRELVTGTLATCRTHWALLAGGGLIWGIASAASLAVFIYGVDDLKLDQTKAASVAIFAAIGAILGNLASDWLDRRRYVLLCLTGLAVGIFCFPWIVHGYFTAALMMVFVSFMFAAPANVLDARLLYLTAQEGHAGRGSTVMSLIHNVFILATGFALSVPLFLSWISAAQQFTIMAIITVIAMGVSACAKFGDK
jgi:predicted MFS family arabinose efflux permease